VSTGARSKGDTDMSPETAVSAAGTAVSLATLTDRLNFLLRTVASPGKEVRVPLLDPMVLGHLLALFAFRPDLYEELADLTSKLDVCLILWGRLAPLYAQTNEVTSALSNDAHSQVSRVSMGSGFDTWPRYGWQPVFLVSRLLTLPCATR
jgi:hypothetical protein